MLTYSLCGGKGSHHCVNAVTVVHTTASTYFSQAVMLLRYVCAGYIGSHFIFNFHHNIGKLHCYTSQQPVCLIVEIISKEISLSPYILGYIMSPSIM